MKKRIALFTLFAALLWVGTASAASVTGKYDSNWGVVDLTESGNRITGTYDCCGGGTISGTRTGGKIQYSWSQPNGSGKGVWNVSADGAKLTGTWGKGDSATGGGDWNLTRQVKSDLQQTGKTVTGTYDSSWGAVHLTETGNSISGNYECCGGGTITGTRSGDRIEYSWSQPSGGGKGVWRISADGKKLNGAWGNGGSNSNGGEWNLTRR